MLNNFEKKTGCRSMLFGEVTTGAVKYVGEAGAKWQKTKISDHHRKQRDEVLFDLF